MVACVVMAQFNTLSVDNQPLQLPTPSVPVKRMEKTTACTYSVMLVTSFYRIRLNVTKVEILTSFLKLTNYAGTDYTGLIQ